MEQMLIQLMPLFLIFAIFYFLLIRPQQRRAKEHKWFIVALVISFALGGVIL
jgi:preprotein translocase subunit YajC